MTIPLNYRGIAEDLISRIDAGEYPPGSKIPSYSQLASLYSVSISTAQRAVMVLRERHRVHGAQGRGVFVLDQDTPKDAPKGQDTPKPSDTSTGQDGREDDGGQQDPSARDTPEP